MNTRAWPVRPFLLLLTLVLALGGVGLALPSPAAAATDGVVTGTVTNGTTGEAMADISVVLSRYDDPTSLESIDTEATTRADGTFRFEALDTSDGFAYVVYVTHLGVTYDSGMLLLSNTPDPTANVTVYETTTDSSVVSASSRGLIVTAIDDDLGIMTVTDVTSFSVAGERTYIGAEANRTATFTVPGDALQVSPRPGFNFGSPLIERNVVYATGPMLPGESTASISYQLPYTGSTRDLSVVGDVPTDAVQILVPLSMADGNLGLDGPSDLIGGDEVTIGDIAYRVWFLTALGRGEAVDVTFTGLPRPAVAQRALRTWMPLIVALGVGLCAAGVTAYGLRSRRLTTAVPAAAQASALRAERERIANELRALEVAWQAGDVEEERYRDERLLILQELRSAARLERQHAGETGR